MGADLLRALRAMLPTHTLGAERPAPKAPADFVFAVGGDSRTRHLVVEFKPVGEPRYLAQAITSLTLAVKQVPRSYPLVAAPYIGPEGRRLCREAGVGYLDFAGNAFFQFDGVYVERQSAERPRRAKARLRRLFAPRSARIARVLLEHRKTSWTLARLAAEAAVSLRTAHLVVAALDEKAFVDRVRGAIRLTNREGLLDLWAESYRLDAHRTETFYSFERSPRALARQLAEQAARLKIRCGLTLHSGASLVAPFVRSPDVHAFVQGDLDRLIKALDLRPTEAGGNVHLLTPNDEGVFYGLRMIEEIPVVCDTQLYLDLVNHPARGREQAAELRRRVLRY